MTILKEFIDFIDNEMINDSNYSKINVFNPDAYPFLKTFVHRFFMDIGSINVFIFYMLYIKNNNSKFFTDFEFDTNFDDYTNHMITKDEKHFITLLSRNQNNSDVMELLYDLCQSYFINCLYVIQFEYIINKKNIEKDGLKVVSLNDSEFNKNKQLVVDEYYHKNPSYEAF